MSKAFTKETDSADDDEGLALPPLPPGGKNYITPSGYARLRAELLDLIDNERPKIVDVVHWAASNGDRSENGDYLYGKKRLREIDRRIRFLTKRLGKLFTNRFWLCRSDARTKTVPALGNLARPAGTARGQLPGFAGALRPLQTHLPHTSHQLVPRHPQV